MAATIGGVIVKVTAQTQQFESGMARAKGQLQTLEATVTKTGVSLRRLAGVIATFVSVRAVVGYFRETADAIDNMAKSADRLGVSTEFLDALQRSAKLGGVEAENLDAALTKLAKSGVDAATGNKALADSFRRIGLDARQFASSSTEDQILQIADALQNTQDAALRVHVAMSLFGRAGAPLVNVLAGGSEQIRAMRVEAERTGTAISRIDAARIEEMNDSLTRLSEAMRGLAVTVLPAIADALTAIVNTVKAVVENLRNPAKLFLALTGGMGPTAVDVAGGQANPRLAAQFLNRTNASPSIGGPLGNGGALITEQMLAAEDFLNSLRDRVQNFGLSSDQTALKGFQSESLMPAETVRAMEDLVAQLERLEAAEKQRVDLENRAQSIIQATRTPQEKLTAALQELAELAGQGLIDPETRRRGEKMARDAANVSDVIPRSERDVGQILATGGAFGGVGRIGAFISGAGTKAATQRDRMIRLLAAIDENTKAGVFN